MKTVFNLGLLLLLIGCQSQMTFLKLSDKINHNAAGQIDRKNLFREARRKVYDTTSFLQKNIVNDTIYVLETYNVELAVVYGRIWTKNNHVSYQYRRQVDGKGLILGDQKAFTNTEISLTEKWDLSELKKDKNSKGYITTNTLVYATRYFDKNGKPIINQVSFYDFFDPKSNNR